MQWRVCGLFRLSLRCVSRRVVSRLRSESVVDLYDRFLTVCLRWIQLNTAIEILQSFLAFALLFPQRATINVSSLLRIESYRFVEISYRLIFIALHGP